jgi:hypothetical protein
MNSDGLARLEDLTRRYARFRPCGAGLGVVWGGLLLYLMIFFAACLVMMSWLLVKGTARFSGFLRVRRDLAGIQPVDE